MAKLILNLRVASAPNGKVRVEYKLPGLANYQRVIMERSLPFYVLDVIDQALSRNKKTSIESPFEEVVHG